MTSPVKASAPLEPTALVVAAILGSDVELARRGLESIAHEKVSATYLVGPGDNLRALAEAVEALWAESVHDMIADLDAKVSHVWILHDDARPRRGALSTLVSESLRVDASLAGSKVLAEGGELESVGGATDVFLRPYSGLTPGEIDQGQYDVVRDVAFIPGASVLIRRDLLRGLDGPDPFLAPDSAAIDLAQRARVAGGRVVVVPSSEVFHDRVCVDRVPGWREQAGEFRALLKVYSPVTLLWALPLALVVSMVNSLGRLAIGQGRPVLNLLYSVAWNIKNIRTTVSERGKTKRIRQVGDEELFRYQLGGSLVLTQLGSDVTSWLRSRTAEGSTASQWMEDRRGFWQEVGFLAAALGLAVGLVASRKIWNGAMPATGYALPLSDALGGLMSYAGGWNPSSLGTPASVHPAVGLVALTQFLLFDRGPLTMTLLTLSSVTLAYSGMVRLLRRLGLGKAGRALGAWATALGPVALASADLGYWPATLASGFAPWAVYLSLEAFPTDRWKRFGRIGFGILATGAMVMLVPLSVVIPLAFVLGWAVVGTRMPGHSRAHNGIARAGLLGAASLVFISPWLVWGSWDDLVFDGLPLWWNVPPQVAIAFLSVLLLTVLMGSLRLAEVAGWGGMMTLVGVWLARSAAVGLGVEPGAAGLVLASLGVGLVIGSAGDLPNFLREHRVRYAAWIVTAGAIGLVAVSAAVMLADGRLGYGPDQFGESMNFTLARSDAHGPDRVLFIGPDLPGGARLVDGVTYRVGSAPVVPLSEAWISDEREGDFALAAFLRSLIDEGGLRPGADLALFGIKWVVSTGDNDLEDAFVARLDMAKLPILDTPFAIYENLEPASRATEGASYNPAGAGWYDAIGLQDVVLAENPAPGWMSDAQEFGVTVTPTSGVITYAPDPTRRALGWLALGVALMCFSAVAASAMKSR